ncbi:MAG TPA: hypothetical protein ENG33_00375 [Chloroflexi bacterium]|nr:hypothetical protein [Chloroflexota bacterium]
MRLIFDSSSLITCCRITVEGEPIIEAVLQVCDVIVPASVSREVTIAQHLYPDASVAARLISLKRIQVHKVDLPPDNVLDHYKLGTGEKEAIALFLEAKDYSFLVTDDRLAYIVASRCAVPVCLFLALLVELVNNGLMDVKKSRKIALATEVRYPKGFVPHTLRILERGERKWLV